MNILDELAERLDNVNIYSGYLSAACLFHEDSRPSMMVYPEWFECKACGAKGRPEKLLAKLGSGSYIQSKPQQHLKNPFTRWMKYGETIVQTLKIAHQNLKSHPWYGKYLEGRGIPYKTQIKCGIGFRDGFITFPVISQTRNVIGGVCRSVEGKQFYVPKDQDPNLLLVPSWKAIETSNMAFLVFGVVDAYSLYVLGKPAMSTLSGKKLNPSALDWCQKKIIIIPDWQEREEAERLASNLGWRGKVKVLEYPTGAKDCNDLLRTGSLISSLAL